MKAPQLQIMARWVRSAFTVSPLHLYRQPQSLAYDGAKKSKGRMIGVTPQGDPDVTHCH